MRLARLSLLIRPAVLASVLTAYSNSFHPSDGPLPFERPCTTKGHCEPGTFLRKHSLVAVLEKTRGEVWVKIPMLSRARRGERAPRCWSGFESQADSHRVVLQLEALASQVPWPRNRSEEHTSELQSPDHL